MPDWATGVPFAARQLCGLWFGGDSSIAREQLADGVQKWGAKEGLICGAFHAVQTGDSVVTWGDLAQKNSCFR